jgi:hypothetical protein
MQGQFPEGDHRDTEKATDECRSTKVQQASSWRPFQFDKDPVDTMSLAR